MSKIANNYGATFTMKETAAGNLDGKEGYFLKLATAENTVELAGDGEQVCIMDSKLKQGTNSSGTVTCRSLTGGSIVRVRAGATLAKGAEVDSGADGRAAASPAGDGVGYKLDQGTCAVNDFISVLLK